MDIFIRNKKYTGPVQAVVLDWAGTAVDYGCIGPAAVFVDVFAQKDIEVSHEEARKFMGLAKKDHIQGMCGLPRVAEAWKKRYGQGPEEADIEELYEQTAVMMVQTLSHHSDPIDGVVPVVEEMRKMGLKIGSSTGYVKEMMDVLVPLAKEKGYHPDAIVCSSDVPAGRPYPWMCYANAIRLETYPMEAMVKIGDTLTDIEEGQNAGMWTVGITRTGNELGLTREETRALEPAELNRRLVKIEARFKQAGAHYILERTADILPVLEEIDLKLKSGELPLKG
ncbi:phosphonoacetaldehyde hydrolase [Desulfospira joergensenii]|uniref:phosphonoacetaldehyde hydrolase n=1 Tax=Desulfospira joergensenii TaxID=53329 RepID=UPI0003B66EF2|nr:phosphonoacetaldehyde hydrolase [Desulfospira joergensenii]